MKHKLDTYLTIVLISCAIITSGAVIRQEMQSRRTASASTDRQPRFIEDWRKDVTLGVQMGTTSAPVQLLEFADFECPFCGDFHKTLQIVEHKYPARIGLTYLHFPIPGHRFAVPAARVAECANEQGRFEAMYDQLFEGQDQFGLKPWDDYATAAGVPDMAAFDACIKKTGPIPRVEGGKALGVKLDVQATPTVIINGWKLGHPPNEQELDQMVKRVLAGKSPVDGKP
jgi:protein-disulfide isomerase